MPIQGICFGRLHILVSVAFIDKMQCSQVMEDLKFYQALSLT
jgi:hypothetical protein